MPRPKNLKQFIKRKAQAMAQGKSEENEKRFQQAVFNEFVIPGEPLQYSVKYAIEGRFRKQVVHFRNQQFTSLIRCCMANYTTNRAEPVCLFVRFFVSPPTGVNIDPKDLAKENIPAVKAAELCDYLLSFQEMLFHGLFYTYRQVVKIEADKFYSKNPRTVFQYMRWGHYVRYKNNNPIYTQTSPFRTVQLRYSNKAKEGEGELVQPEETLEGNDRSMDSGTFTAERSTSPIWASSGSLSLPDANDRFGLKQRRKKKAASEHPPLPKARRRQSGKVSERHTDGEALEGRQPNCLDAALEVKDRAESRTDGTVC